MFVQSDLPFDEIHNKTLFTKVFLIVGKPERPSRFLSYSLLRYILLLPYN